MQFMNVFFFALAVNAADKTKCTTTAECKDNKKEKTQKCVLKAAATTTDTASSTNAPEVSTNAPEVSTVAPGSEVVEEEPVRRLNDTTKETQPDCEETQTKCAKLDAPKCADDKQCMEDAATSTEAKFVCKAIECECGTAAKASVFMALAALALAL
jgi:hypothetical protein